MEYSGNTANVHNCHDSGMYIEGFPPETFNDTDQLEEASAGACNL